MGRRRPTRPRARSAKARRRGRGEIRGGEDAARALWPRLNNSRALSIGRRAPRDCRPFAGRYQGATITSVDVFFKSSGHASLPANFPSFDLFTLALTTAGSVAATSCGNGAISSIIAPDVATYEAMTVFNFACSGVVVSDANTYFLQITDEHGTGAVAGIRYYGCRVNFSGGQLPE